VERNPERLKWIREMNARPLDPPKIELGEGVEIHPTVRLGEEGVGMERDGSGAWVRCRQHGDVRIGPNVRIGPFCNVKRATMPGKATSIGEGSELCTYVNVGHNCRIGHHVFIGPHVCLNGSVVIGDGCWLAAHVVVHQHVKIGDGATVGLGSVVRRDVPAGETYVGAPAASIKFVGSHVHPSFKYGRNLKFGWGNHIHRGVTVGDDCKIKSFVELREGTVFGDGCYIDSGVVSSGLCKIGDRVILRYKSIIAKGTEIEDDVFISPQFMTENVSHRGEEIGGAKIGFGDWDGESMYRVFVGTNVTLAAGIEICPGAIIGSKTNVRKSITEPGVYVGNPARPIARATNNEFMIARA